MTSYRFSRWRPSVILYLLWGNCEGHTKWFSCLNSVLKSLVCRINSSEILWSINFGVLAWNYPFTPFWGSFGGIFFHVTSPIVVTPKRTVFGRKHVVWAIQRKNRCDGSTWPGRPKSHKCVIFPLFEGSPRWADSTQTSHGGWCPRRNHACQVPNWNVRGLRFYRGRIFYFLIDFYMGLTIVQR